MRIPKISLNNSFKNISFVKNEVPPQNQQEKEQTGINPFLSQQLIGVNAWAAQNRNYDKKPTYFNDCDLDKVQKTTLANNVLLNIDTSPINKAANFKLILSPIQKPQTSYASRSILASMIQDSVEKLDDNTLNKDSNSYKIDNYFYEDDGGYLGSLECDYAILDTALDNFLNAIFNNKLSQEEFNKTKNQRIKKFDNDIDAVQTRKFYGLLNGEKEITLDDLKNVTFDDVQKAYSEFKNNSKCQIALLLPKAEYQKSGNKITNILTTKIPNQQPYQVGTTMNIIKENAEFKTKATDEKSIEKHYTISDNNTLKDDVLYMMIQKAIEVVAKNKKFDKVYCFDSTDPQNKYFRINCWNEQQSLDKLNNNINLIIAKLTNSPLDKVLFESIKSDVKSSIKWGVVSDYSKSDWILKKYTDITPKYEDYISKLNSITPEELQQTAQKYFSSPCITEIKE